MKRLLPMLLLLAMLPLVAAAQNDDCHPHFSGSDKSDFDKEIDDEDMKIKLQNAISTLNEREKFVIWNRYLADETMTLEEIGEKYGISKERVRQIESRALEKIKLFTMKQPKLLPQSQSNSEDLF